MKEIRQITDVVSTTIPDDENNNQPKPELLEEFDSEPGYYQQVIKPLLMLGHESMLVQWLKSFGLIRNCQSCPNAKINDDCMMAMVWTPANVLDLFQWRCNGCKQKKGIRESSVFMDVKCSLKNAIRIILGWSKCMDMEELADILGVKKYVVGGLYNTCSLIAAENMKTQLRSWQLGGEDKIVLIDVYPEIIGGTSSGSHDKPILCLTEILSRPQCFWLEILDRFSRNNQTQIENNKQKIKEIIQRMVRPGTLLVAPSESQFCSYDDLLTLSHIYPVIVSVGGLSRHNTASASAIENLNTIWRTPIEICEESHRLTRQFSNQYLVSCLWRSKYGNESFETLLYHLTSLQ